MALLHAPNTAPFWNNRGFERQLQPCSISETCENFAPTYQCWLHSGHHQLGRVHDGVGAYGSQIGVHKCGERPVVVIPRHAAGNNFWALRSLSSSSTVINWPVRELFPSCQESGAPMHQPSFSRRTRQVQGRCKQLLRANDLVGDPTHPGYTSRTILSGNRSEKKPWSGAPLTMQQDDKHCVFARRFLR